MNRKLLFFLVVGVISILGSNGTAFGQAGKAGSSGSGGGGSTAAFESQILAYGGLNHVTSALAKKVCGQVANDPKPVIVIYDQTTFASVQAYVAFESNLHTVESAYQTLVRSAGAEAAPSLPADRAKAAAFAPVDVASLITALAVASNAETAGQVVIPDSSTAIALSRDIKATCNSVSVVYPPLFGFGSTTDLSPEDYRDDIDRLNAVREAAVESVRKANGSYVKAYAKDHPTNSKAVTHGHSALDQTVDTTNDQSAIAPVSTDPVLTAALAEINGLYDSFMNSLIQINAATGTSGSSAVIQGLRLATLLKGKTGYILLASVVNAGGTQRDHKTLWTALTTGDKFTYSGGLVLNAALWSTSSPSPVYQDVLRYRSPFEKIHSPNDVSGLEDGDNLPK